LLEALKIRDFRFLWGGRLISLTGSWLLVVALPAYVFQLTGSLLATGLTLVAEYLPPLVIGPVAGVLTDRWDRRRVMIGSDLFRAGAVALMLLATTKDSLWVIYVALVAESCGSVLFRSAAQAATPAIVGTGAALSSANSLNAFTDGTVRLIAPPVGAALLSLAGFHALIWVDLTSYLVSAAAVLMTARRRRRQQERSTVRRVLADLAAGLRLLGGQPVVRALLPLGMVFLFANASLTALLVPFGVRQLGGAEQIGLVVSALGVGFLIGAVVIRRAVDRVQPRYLLAASQFATAIGFFVLFGSTSLAVALPAAVFIGVFGSMTLVTPQTAVQRVVPNAALGRIGAVFLTGEALATLVGALLGPAVAEATSLWTTAVLACAVTIAGALAGLVVLPVSHELLPARPDAPARVPG
jgi:MFS family permease